MLMFQVDLALSNDAVAAKVIDKVVISFQKQKNPEDIQKSADFVGQFLQKKLGLPVEVLIPTSYGVTSQGLISGKVHVAYMDSLPYILAKTETELEIIAVEKRNKKTNYNSLVLVAKDSPFKTLKDLKGQKIAFSSQTSTSGYLFPFSELIRQNIISKPDQLNQFFSEVIYAGGYDKAMLALANKQTAAAALSDYAFEGAKADLYGTELIRKDLRILTKIPGVPTHLIAVSKNLPKDLRTKIQKALFELAKEKPELLSSVYGAAELVKPSKNHVLKTEEALKLTGLESKAFVK